MLAATMAPLFQATAAQETPAQAIVLAVVGSATVRSPGGATKPATVGAKIDPGATITTGRESQVSIQLHEGIVAIATGNSQVVVDQLSVSADGVRNAVLYLRNGSLATSLDPARKEFNNYAVRTEKGVSRAHGTTMTVSVNGNIYTVSVVAGNVTVDWSGGKSVSIAGNSLVSVTSLSDGIVTSESLGAAMATGSTTGLNDALTAAAAAVAMVATNTGQVTSVIATIAAAAGNSPTASATVAGVTAAAAGAAVANSTLVAAAGGTTQVAAEITTAAVTAATAAGNGSAAALIVTSAVNAVAGAIAGTDVSAVATALTNASNSVEGNLSVDAGQVTASVTAAQSPPTSTVGGDTTADRYTPITPVDPTLVVIRSQT